jgi:hypothetical protein
MQVNTIRESLNCLEETNQKVEVFGRTNLLHEHALHLPNHVDISDLMMSWKRLHHEKMSYSLSESRFA